MKFMNIGKKSLSFLIILLFSVSLVSAAEAEINYTVLYDYNPLKWPELQINQLKYEPYPVNPGEYFDLWIKIENTGGALTKDALFELLPEFPFSLDPNENATRSYGQISNYPVVLKYKVRVDEDAVAGVNELDFRYTTNGKNDQGVIETFEIEVDDAQTDFDLVVQEINEDEVSIAIANTGKNVAYSVIVRIPEQTSFEAVGTNGQMVGNLENGDYTLVGFEIASKSRTGKEPLKIQIDYTDEIGERRSLIKEVPFSTNGNATALPEGMTREQLMAQRGGMMQSEQAIYQKWWFWGFIVMFLYAGWKGYVWVKKKREEKEEKK